MNTHSMNTFATPVSFIPVPFQLTTASATAGSRSAEHDESAAEKKPASFLNLYRFLRAHHQWTLFHAVRYALWLTR